MSGLDKDPVTTTLRSALGASGLRATIAVVLVSFLSCLLSLQAAASRLLFAYARDEMIVGSLTLRKLTPGTHVPAAALVTMGTLPALIALSGLWLADAIATIISFAAIGIYISFQMLVLGALVARVRGWRPSGPYSLGSIGVVVNVLALSYGVAAIINMAWPRSPLEPWYSNYGVLVATTGVLALGLAYMFIGKPYDRGNAPAGDAALMNKPP
jgi:amino acid transporter